MDGQELAMDKEEIQSNSEQFYQQGQAEEEFNEGVLPDQSKQEAHRDEFHDYECEDQVDEVQKVILINSEQKGEKLNIKQEVEAHLNNKEEAEVLETEAEKQIDQNEETEIILVNQEEVEEQVDQEEEAANHISQEEKVELVNEEELDNNKDNQAEVVTDYLQHNEHTDLKQDIVKEVNTQKASQEEFSLQGEEVDLQKKSKEEIYQEQEVEEQVTYKRKDKEQVNNKVKEHFNQHEEHINYKQKYIENLDQKNAEVDWKEKTNKGVPEYRRKSITESRHKWEELDKQQHQTVLDNRNLGERKFIEKEFQTAGVIMSETKTSRFGGNTEKCAQCNRTVYAMEKMEVSGRVMHKTCFRCCKCNSQLSVGRFSVGGGNLYCLTHYKQAFREKGTYDVFTPDNPCKGKWQQNIDTPKAPKAQE